MIAKALEGWDATGLDALFIENVGNLICPAEYDLGEDLRVALLSVTEGEDKPLKYPLAFNSSHLAAHHQERHCRSSRVRPRRRAPLHRASESRNGRSRAVGADRRWHGGVDDVDRRAYTLEGLYRGRMNPGYDAAADSAADAPLRVGAPIGQAQAPPGYGKSSLARLFARRFDRHAICDCAGTADSIDFAGRAMSALAAESQNGGESAAFARLRLHATEADAATWSRALLETWKGRQEHALFILEHAEAIAENGSVLALLGDLLAARPGERVVLVSSRVPLPLRVGHYLAPHQILTLSQDELRFKADEAAATLRRCGDRSRTRGANRPARRRLAHRSLLLARFAQYDSAFERLIDRLESVPALRLHEYLAGEVLSEFTPDMMSTILATAAIPEASLEDIAAATGIRHATPIIDRLLNCRDSSPRKPARIRPIRFCSARFVRSTVRMKPTI